MKKDIIPFTDTATPTITDYQTNYAATYGPDPDVRCIIIESATKRFQRQQEPQFTYVNGLLDTIYFELMEILTGYLILS